MTAKKTHRHSAKHKHAIPSVDTLASAPPAPAAEAAQPERPAPTAPKAGKKRPTRGASPSLAPGLVKPAARASSALDAAVQAVLHEEQRPDSAPAVAPSPTRSPDGPSAAVEAPVRARRRTEERKPKQETPTPANSSPGADAATTASRQGEVEAEPPASPQPMAASPEPAQAPTLPVPDFDALAVNMGQFIEESGKAAAAYLKPRDEQAQADPFSRDVTSALKTLGDVAQHWFSEPNRLIEAQTTLSSQLIDLWASSLQRFTGAAPAAKPEPANKDKRFADPEWRENPFFDFVRRAYLIGTDWANAMVEGAESLDPPTREKARFYMRQISSALSPSNFVPTNPELLRETLKQNGANLVRGMGMLAEDIAAGKGDLKVRQTDTSKFALGVNMALTPGKVVLRNDLMELLQYAPSTETVLKRPLLIVPPWINKYYILDLNPDKSFIRWAVAQGLTVFVVSWINPDARHADKDWEAYMREGIFASLDAIAAATGETDVATIGYCVGGTLLAVSLAYMAAKGDRRVSSATLFTTQVDFSHAGDLKAFADEGQIRAVESQMRATGFLKGTKMAQAFNMLRPDDLIWSYVVNNYLKGKEPLPFDLLAWNSDSTRMPAANHSFYLRNCYLENNLTRGLMEVGGERLDLGKVGIPIYNLATREDHIAPARSVFEGSRFFGGPVRYVLAGSGHIAGVVNPPARAKYGYWLGPKPEGSLETWLEAATEQPGSWWPDWFEWLRAQAPDTVPAREPGGGVLEILEDAPGSYVKIRS